MNYCNIFFCYIVNFNSSYIKSFGKLSQILSFPFFSKNLNFKCFQPTLEQEVPDLP